MLTLLMVMALHLISPIKSIYDVKVNSLEGEEINFADFKGKKILIVNTASKCGFTKQYKDLEQLHKLYAKKLVIIGFQPIILVIKSQVRVLTFRNFVNVIMV